MSKVKYKDGVHEKIYEVYGIKEYDDKWGNHYINFLVYWCGSWSWMDANKFEPVENI